MNPKSSYPRSIIEGPSFKQYNISSLINQFIDQNSFETQKKFCLPMFLKLMKRKRQRCIIKSQISTKIIYSDVNAKQIYLRSIQYLSYIDFNVTCFELWFFKELEKTNWRIITLMFYSCQFSDSLAKGLSIYNFKDLEDLIIRDNHINNKGIKQITQIRLPSLKSIHLRNTNVTTDCLKIMIKSMNRMQGWGIDCQQHMDIISEFKCLPNLVVFKKGCCLFLPIGDRPSNDNKYSNLGILSKVQRLTEERTTIYVLNQGEQVSLQGDLSIPKYTLNILSTIINLY